MTCKQLQVEGMTNLLNALEENKGKTMFLMFTGAINESGDSWCSDCRKGDRELEVCTTTYGPEIDQSQHTKSVSHIIRADPVVEKGLQEAPEDSVFIMVVVGDRPTWSKADNEFRTSEFKLTGIPTLLQYGTPKRLEPEQCSNPDLVGMLFQEA